jgi:hypothetical protein
LRPGEDPSGNTRAMVKGVTPKLDANKVIVVIESTFDLSNVTARLDGVHDNILVTIVLEIMLPFAF